MAAGAVGCFCCPRGSWAEVARVPPSGDIADANFRRIPNLTFWGLDPNFQDPTRKATSSTNGEEVPTCPGTKRRQATLRGCPCYADPICSDGTLNGDEYALGYFQECTDYFIRTITCDADGQFTGLSGFEIRATTQAFGDIAMNIEGNEAATWSLVLDISCQDKFGNGY